MNDPVAPFGPGYRTPRLRSPALQRALLDSSNHKQSEGVAEDKSAEWFKHSDVGLGSIVKLYLLVEPVAYDQQRHKDISKRVEELLNMG